MSELRRRILEGESQTLDFKFRIDDQRKIARTLAAFANSEGGSLLIGVKDNGKIVGTNPEEEYYMVEGAADLHTHPRVPFESRIWKEGHHLVLEIVVEKSEMKHKAKDEEGKMRSYVRVEDHTLLGNKIIERIWRLEREGLNRPEKFDDETLGFIRLVRELEPVSLSKLYRNSKLSLKKVDQLLAVLVFWGIVKMDMNESGTRYSLMD